MAVAVINELWFTDEESLAEGREVARDYDAAVNDENPAFESSMWMSDRTVPLHCFHVVVFRDDAALAAQANAERTQRFLERLIPLVRQDESFRAPYCDVWLSTGNHLPAVPRPEGAARAVATAKSIRT